jgi:uncharacterized protein YjdB
MIAKYMRTISRKALAVIVALAMLLAMAPMWAQETFAASGYIDMSVTNPAASGTGWTYDDDSEVYTILKGADVTVTGDNGASDRRLEVATDAAVKITLDGVTIGAAIDDKPTLGDNNSPLKLNAEAKVTLTIEGTNSLAAGENQAGINAPEGTTLSISGDGALSATGGYLGAGIGGGYTESGGEITISGGAVTANGGFGGAGIGGGDSGNGGETIISGGEVEANGFYGAGIGGGYGGEYGGEYGGSGGTITISGGDVTATSEYVGAGIGGGAFGSGGEITISGGTVTANGGGSDRDFGGAGIGSGATFRSVLPLTGGDITICGEAVVNAKGGAGADDIGAGIDPFGGAVDPGNQFIAAVVGGAQTYKVVGNPTLPEGITANIPANQTMEIPEGKTLTIKGALNVYGTLDNKGILDNQGVVTIKEGGKLTGDGAVTGNPPKYAYIPKAATKETPVPLRDIPGAKTPVEAGTAAKLPKSIIFDDLTRADVTWTSADQSIAAIDPYGNLIGVKEGKTTLTATAKDGKTQTVAITVAKNVTTIRTPQKAIHMQKGATLTPPVCADSVNPATNKSDITAKLTWGSSDPKIATVNAATGKIKARKAGKAKITATALNGEKLTITISVAAKAIPLKTITLKKAPNSLKAGHAMLLSVKTTPYPATNLKITFSSSDKKILSVDKAGKLTAIKKGTAKITVKANNKKYIKAITVK